MSRSMQEMGEFKMLDKWLVDASPDYQRSQTTYAKRMRIAAIVRDFKWPSFGALRVSKTEDGRYVCMAGGGRITAARQIDRITTVPCMVYDLSNRQQAEVFTDNAMVVALTWTDKYKAGVIAKDPVFLEMKELIDASGRSAGSCSSKNTICCLNYMHTVLKSQRAKKARALKQLWTFINRICLGEPMPVQLVSGLVTASTHLVGFESFTLEHLSRIEKIGYVLLKKAVRDKVAMVDKASSVVYARAIIEAHNKGLRKNKLEFDEDK